jgi:methionyl aminopeptidase
MTVSRDEELEGLRRVGRLVAETQDVMERALAVGTTTRELDALAAEHAGRAGARSAPQLTYGFPGFTCISVNEEIVHGVPGPRRLEAGDVVTLDVTLELDGYMADSARTVIVGAGSSEAEELVETGRIAFHQGSQAARAGRRLRDVGAAVERAARRRGAFVVRELCGHGIGRRLHEEPEVPNWSDPHNRTVLHDGLVLALEPMLTAAPARVVEERDRWTLRTHNRCLAVHHEHTIMVQAKGAPLVLTCA